MATIVESPSYNKLVWLYRMGMHDTLRMMGLTEDDLKFLHRNLYPVDAAFFYCPYIPFYVTK